MNINLQGGTLVVTISPATIQEQKITLTYSVLAELLGKDSISVALLDLSSWQATVLKSTIDAEIVGQELPWHALVSRYTKRRACEEDHAAIFKMLSAEQLEACIAAGEKKIILEVRCQVESGALEWVEISLSLLNAAAQKLLVSTRNINEERLMKCIISRFLYRHCDYFVLIDTRRDTYTMFSATESGSPVPSISNACYTSEMIRFNKRYVVPEEVERVTANMQIPHLLEKLAEEEEYTFTCGALTRNNNYRRSRLQFVYYDKAGGLVLCMRTDITLLYLEEKAKNEQLLAALREAQTDALTQLYNQKTCADLVSRALKRQDYKPAALLFVDIDNFKQVNDTLGHLKGNELLCLLADAFRKSSKSRDIVGRIGGDEFLLYLPDITTQEDVACFAARLCGAFKAITAGELRHLPISCSVGIALYPQDGTTYEKLVRKADQALYSAKRYGKNTYYFFSEGIGNPASPSMLSEID